MYVFIFTPVIYMYTQAHPIYIPFTHLFMHSHIAKLIYIHTTISTLIGLYPFTHFLTHVHSYSHSLTWIYMFIVYLTVTQIYT